MPMMWWDKGRGKAPCMVFANPELQGFQFYLKELHKKSSVNNPWKNTRVCPTLPALWKPCKHHGQKVDDPFPRPWICCPCHLSLMQAATNFFMVGSAVAWVCKSWFTFNCFRGDLKISPSIQPIIPLNQYSANSRRREVHISHTLPCNFRGKVPQLRVS